MKFGILLYSTSFITLVIVFQICFQEPCLAAERKTADFYKYNDALEYCAKEGPMEMPLYDVYIDGYLCYTLLHEGPCKRNNWLVANKLPDKPFVECKRRLCEENKIRFRHECRHKNESSTLCGESQILLMNPFGEGMMLGTSENIN